MNVHIADLNETRKTLTVTLDQGEVNTAYQGILGEYSKQASLPGFRPGRAPAQLVVKRFGKEIREEFKSRVISQAYRDGLAESKLEVLALVDVEEGAVEPGLSAAIKLTVDIRPAFTLPEYKGLVTEVKGGEPTAEEIDAVIQGLRSDRADFKAADRPARKGDYVKFSYEGTLDGQPLDAFVGDKTIYAKAPQTWEEVEGAHEGLLPGMASQLAGLQQGDKKTVTLTYPAGFSAAPGLAGRTVAYAIDVQEVRERALPPLDEAFFKANETDSLAGLQAQVKQNLTLRKQYENRAEQRRQISDALLAAVSFPAPESLVAGERDSVLRQFIEENMRRGVPQEELEKNKKELYESATRAASSRVRLQLILARIAEAEKIKVEEQDLNSWLMQEAMRSGQRAEKFAKELGKDREQVRAIQQQILFDKALDFLVTQATVKAATLPPS